MHANILHSLEYVQVSQCKDKWVKSLICAQDDFLDFFYGKLQQLNVKEDSGHKKLSKKGRRNPGASNKVSRSAGPVKGN